jgi:uncharacterized protein YukE
MATYTVDLSNLADAAVQLDSVTSGLVNAMSDLQAKVTQFLDANQGQAIANYNTVQQQWSTGMSQVQEGNAKATSVLRQIGENYHAGDQQGAAIFVP